MKINLIYKKPKKIKADYPIVLLDKFIAKETCENLCKEIKNFSNFDDLVMNGRYRVNKGSETFSKSLSSSPYLSELYKSLNNLKTYKKMEKILKKNNLKSNFSANTKNLSFSKDSYGQQKFNFFDYFRKTKIISSFFKPKINLDMDFSKSKRGYFRQAHRDRDTRVISFLIYLNNISKKDGGQFEVYKSKKNYRDPKLYKRFPENNTVLKINKFPPVSGQMFVFLSTPNSYHGVSKSLDRNVQWDLNR